MREQCVSILVPWVAPVAGRRSALQEVSPSAGHRRGRGDVYGTACSTHLCTMKDTETLPVQSLCGVGINFRADSTGALFVSSLTPGGLLLVRNNAVNAHGASKPLRALIVPFTRKIGRASCRERV